MKVSVNAPLIMPTPESDQPLILHPNFLGALRGIWLFTWKPQLTWRRLPLGALMLLALPALVYLTVLAPERWTRRRTLLLNPEQTLRRFAVQLDHTGYRLAAENRDQLRTILQEEFERAEARLHEAENRDAESSVESQKQQIKNCFDRIRERVQSVLSRDQAQQFEKFEVREVRLRQGQVGQSSWGRTGPFYHWLIDFYFFVILPLQCVKVTGGLIRDELQADTLGFLLTRPISRAQLLVVKYLTQTAWLQMVLVVQTLLLFGVGWLRHIPSLGALLPLFLGAQFLAVLAWSALGVFLGQISKRYLAVALVYGLIVEMGIGRIPTNINTLSLIRHLKTLLSHNLTLKGIYDWTATGVPLAIGALALATVVFVTLAALLFTIKEYHHTAEMQK